MLSLTAVWWAGTSRAEEGQMLPSRRFNIGGVLHDNSTELHFRNALRVSRGRKAMDVCVWLVILNLFTPHYYFTSCW